MEKREREREMEMEMEETCSSTLTVMHIGDIPDIPCREVSVELFRMPKH